MPYPTTTALPAAPSRISDPVNFVNESALYLQSLPAFRTQFNALTAYINTKFPNYNNYGTVVDVNPTFPTVATFASGISGSGVGYISSIDTFLENLGTNSLRANNYGAYIDAAIAAQGSIASDPKNPIAFTITPTAPTRAQARAAFNTSAVSFTDAVQNTIKSLANSLGYVKTTCYDSESYGLVTEAITDTDDYGRFSAAYLDGTKKLDGTYTLSVTQTPTDIVLDSSVTTLFSGGKQGVALDFDDLSLMFRDDYAYTPVTATGQSIGLILDKSKGLALGATLITNGAFTTNITGWTNYSAARGTVSYNTTDKRLRVDNTTGTGNDSTWVATAVTQNTVYKLEGNIYDVKGETANVTVYWWNGTTTIGTLQLAPAFNNAFNMYVRAPAGATGLLIGSTNTAGIWELDNITLKSVAGNHVYQSVAGNRPTLQRNTTTGHFYAAFNGTTNFLQSANIDFTASDEVSVFAAVRKNSDTATGIVVELSADANANAGSFYVSAPQTAATANYGFVSRGSTAANAVTASSYAAPNTAVICAQGKISTDLSQISANNSVMEKVAVDQGTGNYGNLPLYIGRRGGASLPFNGHLYALIVVNKVAPDGEVYDVETILADRVGILV